MNDKLYEDIVGVEALDSQANGAACIQKKHSARRNILILSFIMLLAALVLLIYVTYTWFYNQRKVSTVTWIKTPIILTIGSGNNHDIAYLDMGDIDVESGTSKDYVFCVYGTPVDNYSLQLAYTTNIDLTYEIYRAACIDDSTAVTTDDSGKLTYRDSDSKTFEAVEFTYSEKDSNGNYVDKAEYFYKLVENEEPVIKGLTYTALYKAGGTQEVAKHQSHSMSYGNDYGANPVPEQMVQKNAEPLYWLATENGTSVLSPKHEIVLDDGTKASLDYFILHVSWDPDEVSNDKETDIVYLTASR